MKTRLYFLILVPFVLFGCKPKQDQIRETPQTQETAVVSDLDTALTRNISKKDGVYEEKNSGGFVIEKGEIKAGKQEGQRNTFFDDGKIKTEEHYKNGNFDGSFKEYFPNGKLYQEGVYVNNSMSGIWKTYYDTGELKEEVNFKDNSENGPFKSYHKNGKVKYEGIYKDGDHEEGELKVYNENGELVKKLDCNKGKCNTIWVKKGYEDIK